MTAPYGSWMGSEIEDAFSLPDELTVEIQSFVKQIDALLSPVSANAVAVLYDVGSNARIALEREVFADNRVNDTNEAVDAPFWSVTRELGRRGVPFDVVAVNDDVVESWRLDAAHLQKYVAVVVPGDEALPDWATTELAKFEAGGGVVLGTTGRSDQGARTAGDVVGPARQLSPVHVTAATPVGVNTHALDDGGMAVHLVNYDLDHERGALRPAHDVRLRLPLLEGRTVRIVRPDGPWLEVRTKSVGGASEVVVPVLNSYAVVEVRPHGNAPEAE
jgi:hypothetical protein